MTSATSTEGTGIVIGIATGTGIVTGIVTGTGIVTEAAAVTEG